MPNLIAQVYGTYSDRAPEMPRGAVGQDVRAPQHPSEMPSMAAQQPPQWASQNVQHLAERIPDRDRQGEVRYAVATTGGSVPDTLANSHPVPIAEVESAEAIVGGAAPVTESGTLADSGSGMLDRLQSYVMSRGPDLAEGIAFALIIAYIGKYAARFTFHFLQNILRRARVDETLTKFLARIAQAAVLTFAAIAALNRLGVNTSSLAAVIAAAGLAVGLALQGSLSNFAAGVMLILFRPFSVGDFVEAAGTKGIVEEIHVFHTVMRTPDNVRIIVPNGSITASNISNYSAEPIRRIDLIVGCGYKDNLVAVKQFLLDTIQSDPRVRTEPKPVVAVHELGNSSVDFVVRPWVASTDYWATRWDLIEAVKLGFDANGFQIPFPQRDMHIHHSGSVAGANPNDNASLNSELGTAPSEPVSTPETAKTAAVPPGLMAPRRAA